jgi:hypothetical protein
MNSDKNGDELPVTCSKYNMIFESDLDDIRHRYEDVKKAF